MANPTVQFLQAYQRNRTTVWVALLIVGIAIFIYFKGKRAGETTIKDAPYIKGTAGIPAGFNPNILAEKLFDAMDGFFTLSGTKDEAWNELATLQTDDMVVSVYNTFNKKYAAKKKGSLTRWIKDEYYYDFTTGIRDKAIKRLSNLRLN